VHAESNACLHAGRERTVGATLYLFGYDKPCFHCSRLMINAGIVKCVAQKCEGSAPEVTGPDGWVCEPDEVRDWIGVNYVKELSK